METSNEIRSTINNIRYYVKKLQELTKLQLEKDIDTGNLLGINVSAGSRVQSGKVIVEDCRYSYSLSPNPDDEEEWIFRHEYSLSPEKMCLMHTFT